MIEDLGKWMNIYKYCRFPYQMGEISLKLPEHTQLEIIADPETPTSVVESFSGSRECSLFSEKVREIAAGRSDNNSDFLNNYRNDESDLVRVALAKNENIGVETLTYLAGDSNSVIRDLVKNHSRVTSDILEKIGQNQGFVCVDQFCYRPTTIEELKKEHPESDHQVTYSPIQMEPRWGSAVYRIEADGKMTFISSNYDTSD